MKSLQLSNVVKNPLLLWMTLETLNFNIDQKKLSRSQLYQNYLKQWFETQTQRSIPKPYPENLISFAEKLAWKMYETKNHQTSIDSRESFEKYLEGQYGSPLKLANFEEGKLGSKIPIFQFIHYTFYEYLVASQLFEELKVNF